MLVNRHTLRIVGVVLLLGSLSFVGNAHLCAADQPGEAICRLMAEAAADGRVAGAQVAVGDARGVLRKSSFGVRRVGEPAAVDDDTMFCIGSCSKMFAAAVLVELAEKRVVVLDTPIDRWLEEFAAPRVQGQSGTVGAPTLRQLLCHRGGVYSQRDRLTASQVRWIRDFRLTLAESVQGIAAEPLATTPGERYAYSGAGYCVLGRVAEVAAEQSFEELLQRVVCRPLQLKHTTFFPDADNDNIAVGHLRKEDRLVIESHTPHLLGAQLRLALIGGSLYSTAGDVAQFARMLASEGRAGGRTVLSQRAYSAMTSPQSPRPGKPPYGFGLGLTRDGANRRTIRLAHSGALFGSFSYVAIDLETKRFGVVTYTGPLPGGAVQGAVADWVGGGPL